MYKIGFVIPYFGKLPKMFTHWLISAGYNSTIDFLIFSDNEKPLFCPSNVKWNCISFACLKDRINRCVGFQTALNNPYKLCDFKPTYGDVFEQELKDYDFWGWCDIDLIFGNIRNFITDELLESYDKIGSLGHCVILRNNYEMRTMYKNKIGGGVPLPNHL